MKSFLLSSLIFFTSVVGAAPADNILSLLQQMQTATKQLDYEVNYILATKNNIEPLRYRHAIINDKPYAQISYLAGATKEVIRRGDEITYFEPGFEPYTVASNKMVGSLPILVADFARLQQHYNFTSLGQGREAGLTSHVIRVSPKSGEGFSYLLWIDQKSKLLVRSDLVDENNNLLKQVRAVEVSTSPTTANALQHLPSMTLPAAIQQLNRNQITSNWVVNALPKRFFPIAHHRYRLLSSARPVENFMFTDGLFSFSIYFAQADTLSSEKIVVNNERSIYSQVKGNVEISLVGEIPPAMAKDIVNSIAIKAPTTN